MTAFTGQTAIVTGASRGIGLAIASRLARDGADIVAVDLPETDTTELAAAIAAHGRALHMVHGSVADSACWREAVAAAPRLEMLVNNAGIAGPVGSLVDYPDDDFDSVMAVNARGVFLGMKYALPRLLETGGRIVNVSSVSGIRGGGAIMGYTASKHAVIGMTYAAATEFGPKGVRINAVCPAPVQTGMMDELARIRMPDNPQAFTDAFRGGLPMGRYAEPDEIAGAVVFLLGPDASFISGAALAVDGGALARG